MRQIQRGEGKRNNKKQNDERDTAKRKSGLRDR